jgi:hypothetical protein
MTTHAIMDNKGVIESSDQEQEIMETWDRLDDEDWEEVMGVEISGDLRLIEIKDCKH